MVPNRGNNFRINLAAFPPNWRPTENFHALFILIYFDFIWSESLKPRKMLLIIFIFLFSFIFARPGLITSMSEFGVEMERNLISIYRTKPVSINLMFNIIFINFCFSGGKQRDIANSIRWIALYREFCLLWRQSRWNGDYGGVNKLRGAFS